MPAVGAPRSFENKFAFTIEIDNVAHAGFNKMSELSKEHEVVAYREGGSLIPHKSPGLVTYADVTLERGAVASDSDLYDWMETVSDVAANEGAVDDDYKRNLDVVVKDRDGTVIKRWRLYNAWPNKFVAGEWDNDASEKTIEMVTLSYDYFKRIAV